MIDQEGFVLDACVRELPMCWDEVFGDAQCCQGRQAGFGAHGHVFQRRLLLRIGLLVNFCRVSCDAQSQICLGYQSKRI